MSLKKKIVWLPYDMDTAIGINNEGELVFDYRLEDIDQQQSGADVYNGQQSVVWKNIRAAFPNELAAMYQSLRSSGAISYAKVEQMFEEHQGKWPETVFNEDSYFKYIEPLLKDNVNYLGMLLGSKAEQRKWWLYNRFRYIDSKYVAGDALTDYIMIRPYAAQGLSITPYADIYTTVKWDDQTVQKRTQRGTTAVIPCPYQTMNDNVVWIYSASQLASIGDISGLQVGLCDISMATRLQGLKIGDASASYENANLRSLTLGNNVLLKTIDARNCSGLGDTSIQGHTQTSVNLSGCTILENVYFGGTKINGLPLPNGGVLKVLSLPKTLTSLIVLNQSKITTFEIEANDYSNITTLRIENCSSAVPVLEILSDLKAKSRVRIIGLQMSVNTTEEVEALYDKLDTMTGLDENGNNLDKAVVSGTITGLGTITGEWLAQMYERYPNITIKAQTITSVLTFMSYDGTTVLGTANYENGSIVSGQTIPAVPARPNSADGHYTYTAVGWNTEPNAEVNDPDAVRNVVADRTVYPAYTASVAKYTVTWVNNGTTIETDTNVPWGTVPHYDGSTPTKDGQTSTGWSPDPTQPITGNTTFTAQYLPVYTVTFKNDTGTTTLDTQNVVQGQTATYGGAIPTSSEDASLAWLGWATSANSHRANAVLTNVQSSMTVYAAFESAVEVAEITDSWDTIIANIDNGTYSTKYKVGNYKPLDLGTEGTINMQIVAMDADELADGSGYAPLTFIGMELLKSYMVDNEYIEAPYYWGNNKMRNYLNTTILPLINTSVMTRVQTVNKYSIGYLSGSRNVDITYDKLWVPSAYEAGLDNCRITNITYATERMGVTYDKIFKSDTNRIKVKTGTTSVFRWGIRTTGTNNTAAADVSIPDTGRYELDAHFYYTGVCLGFCLGLEPETIEDSWSTILANTNPSATYSIGDTKMIDLGTEGKHLMEIVAFNEDDKADGSGKAKITWISKDLLKTTHRMNPSDSSGAIGTGGNGGWENCEMRTYLKNTIKPLIPAEVRNAIVNVTKIQSTVTDGTKVIDGQTTTDDVWIPSNHEIYSTNTSYETTGATYRGKFNSSANRIKKRNGSNSTWWMRSATSTANFRRVTGSGDANDYGASNYTGVALGFCTD